MKNVFPRHRTKGYNPVLFFVGLQHYLSDHKWGNAKTIDLWTALGAASGKPVPEVMDTWTKKVGFPLVKVEALTLSNGKCLLTLSQHRFLSSGRPTGDQDQTIWNIEVPFFSPSQPTPLNAFHLTNRTQTFELPIGDCQTLPTSTGALVLNRGETSVIRVFYNDAMRVNIGRHLFTSLAPSDRLGFQSDLFATSKSGFVLLSAVLDMTSNYKQETVLKLFFTVPSL